MPIIVTMPALSPTMEEGVISSWLKNEGDKVSDGEALCEIATDKSTVEFQAIDGGFLRKILIPAAGTAKVNAPIAVITETEDEDISSLSFEQEKQEEEKQAADAPAPKEEEKKSVGGSFNAMTFSPPQPAEKVRVVKKSSINASPLAKKLAQENGLDITSVKGSGPSGRVIAKDLEGAQKVPMMGVKETSYKYPDGTFDEVPLTPVRKIIGERLQASKMTIPHYVVTQAVSMTKAMELRVELKELGIKVTFNDFVIKAVALALKKHPDINMGYDSKKNVIIQYKTIDISLAVSVPDGLITPILWQADYMSLTDISTEAKKLAIKAKKGTLAPHEYQGGSFTISNLGMFGVTGFQAVINPPQAAILAVGGIAETAISKEGKIGTGYIMNISISMDHRVIDGAEGAKFLNTVKFFLENPSSLIL
ncbi:MAG: Dihydrolipoyllysine-residue succinyltransferase component of 2-oxoglutarate dehydrogenase complex [Chlamydiia bacterium]|nr:Dihydrolipoyllysine-residue succinyltransferase component of 2-oxoglutarate dehydrogenase complex [Chlamydiia bacterium]MCH9617994.1 Dihydrolipoyllysine-residue succinyltransferase component of 2-oxoglutarate dehydrogenase complex [Chlamydiia bacterium]MCH9623681.1 Dihydrolipoyllysine-residue succinyltransferase component of 2-oxoglutarate dehydrogenase complex [Chlamydiia bacterium]